MTAEQKYSMDVHTQQPQSGAWKNQQMMPHPGQISGCPPGLEYLTMVDQLLLKQEIHLAELLGWECKNKFRIFNSMEQQVYFAREESSVFQRMCCAPGHGFKFHIEDNTGQDIITLHRQFKCCNGCCWCADGCCIYPIVVFDRQGRRMGMVRQMGTKCLFRFGIFDEQDQFLYDIWAPSCCPIQAPCCTADVNFEVVSAKDGSTCGCISKVWRGGCVDIMTDADSFRTTFKMDMDPKHKALIIATAFLIDFSVFEHHNNNNGGGY